jgi:cyclase
MALQKVGERTYVETEYNGANVSCVVSEQGLVLIDTPYVPEEVTHWQAQLRRISDREVAYVINTDHHFDHTLGTHVLGGLVVAHELAYEKLIVRSGTLREVLLRYLDEEMRQAVDEIAKTPIALPHIIFNDRMTLRLGDATFEMMALGGHTAATIMVYLGEDRILFSGDNVVTNRHPFKVEAGFADWIEALKKVQEMDIDTIVPGHGDLTEKSEASRMLVYFRRQWDTAARLRRLGKSRDEVIGECNHLLDFYPMEPGTEETTGADFDGGIGRLYDEISRS